MAVPSPVVARCLLVALVLIPAGCGRHLQQTFGPLNQRPVVRLEGAVVSTGDLPSAAASLRWTAIDPDGRVDHFLVTEDPAAYDRESRWTFSTARERTLTWRRTERGAASRAVAGADGFRFFAVKAVDDRGAVSEVAYRAFFDENVAPTVTITSPSPCVAIERDCFPPSFIVRWTGSDADGPNGRPAEYKYKLFQHTPEVPWWAWLTDPDSLRRTYAPTFAGWDSISGDSTQLRLSGLAVGAEYLFVITALDAEGAYDPVFSLCKNMLRMCVSNSSSALGPQLTMFNDFFSYTYPSGGMPEPLPDSWVIRIQAPSDRPLTVNWSARAHQYSTVTGYRWALDIEDVHDERARRNRNDITHWSGWSIENTSVSITESMISKLASSAAHRLYVEATDENGFVSLGVVEFRSITPTFDRDLLIVDDTRFAPDMLSRTQPPGRTDSLRAPSGSWPMAAELDTFLFAVGGVRWRMTPRGWLSTPGLFHGYGFDTLGTRRGLEDPTIPLEVLGHYRHIVWVVDGHGSEFYGSPLSSTTPITTLQYMSRPNRSSTLAVWVKSGGSLWALGGGFGNATNAPWDVLGNNTDRRVYSSLGSRPDLTPGRFMYDFAHWRSEFATVQVRCRVDRAPFASGSPGYGMLPATLRTKQAAGDPLPPRFEGVWFDWASMLSPTAVEYLSKPNTILEDRNPSPRHQAEVRTLDTLMVASATGLPLPGADPAVDRIVNPVMTLYHGSECGSVVFTGIDIWSWARADCRQVVDAVLQGTWGLTRAAKESPGRTGVQARTANK